MEYALILVVGLIAGTIGGIVGFGASIMLLPVLVLVFGPVEAVPIMAIAALMANLSRVIVWWKEIDWRAVLAYSITGVVGAVFGAMTLLTLPQIWIEGMLGGFFIAMIPIRRWLLCKQFKFGYAHLAACGLVVGYITGIVVSTGPITVPIFLAHGLVMGAFIATEAASSLFVYGAKAIVFYEGGVLPPEILIKGLITGLTLMAGTVISKRFLVKFTPEHFRLLMDGLMLLSGAVMLWAALTNR